MSNDDIMGSAGATPASYSQQSVVPAVDALAAHSDRVHDAMVEFFQLHPCSASGHTECTAKWELIQATAACHYSRAETRAEGHKEGYLSRVQDEQVAAAAPLNAMTAERDALAEDYEALAATPAHVLDVLILSWAIDEHAQAVPPEEPVHNGGTCSDDCAGDIRARYARLASTDGRGTAWVRYRLQKGKIVLTFRVPRGTPMVMEQAGWEVEGAVIEAAAPALDSRIERLIAYAVEVWGPEGDADREAGSGDMQADLEAENEKLKGENLMTVSSIDAPIVLREQIEADGTVSRVEAWLATDGDESKQQIVISETDTRLSWGGTLRLGFDAKGELVRLVVDGEEHLQTLLEGDAEGSQP